MAAEKAEILKAINFAAKKHRNQRRKDLEQTPYINHPIGVSDIICNEGNVTDTDVIIAGILHDTVEDTDTTLDELEEVFGKKVRDIVDECSDDKSLTKEMRKMKQIEKAPLSSKEAKVVKLADKIYNLRDLNRQTQRGWSDDRVNEYFIWSSKVFAGLRGSCPPLENILESLLRDRGVSN